MSGPRVSIELIPTFRFAWRTLAKRPADSLLAMATLGIGILAVLVAFDILYGSLLRGMPYPEGERLVHVLRVEKSGSYDGLSFGALETWGRYDDLFEGLGGFYSGTVNVGGDEVASTAGPERFDGTFLTPNLIEILGVQPLLGPGFSTASESTSAPLEMLLGESVWRRRYDAHPGVVGMRLRVNGESAVVVGVMPESFRFPRQQEVWVGYRAKSEDERGMVGKGEMIAVGRLASGIDASTATVALAARGQSEERASGEALVGQVAPLLEWFMPTQIRQLFYLLWVGAACVLLIACANVASLLLARASARGREIATRLALGAGRERVVWDRLAEGLLLALGGGLFAYVLGLGLDVWMVSWAFEQEDVPTWANTRDDPMVPIMLLVATVAAGLLAGLVPAMQAGRDEIATLLKDDSRAVSSLRIGRFHRAVVAFEVAAACALLLAAGLMTRTVFALESVDLPATEETLTARVGLFETRYPKPEVRQRFYERLVTEVEALPGVASVVLASSLPTAGLDGAQFRLPNDAPDELRGSSSSIVSPGYFDAFGIPLLAGRGFDTRDIVDSEPVVIVNRSLAENLWPDEEAVGQVLEVLDEGVESPVPRRVIGLVPDAFVNGLDDDHPEGFYLPLAQSDRRFLSLAIRTHGDPMALADTLRKTVTAIDPDLPIYWVQPLSGVVRESRFSYDFFGGLCIFLGAAAVILAAFGVYGVMAFTVGQRTHEIGIRLALGARPAQILGHLLRQGLTQLAWGMPFGLLGGVVASRVLTQHLYGVEPFDPWTFAAVPLLLAGVVLLACWLPIRRILRRAPMDALRYD